jgi:hypothetical protein
VDAADAELELPEKDSKVSVGHYHPSYYLLGFKSTSQNKACGQFIISYNKHEAPYVALIILIEFDHIERGD